MDDLSQINVAVLAGGAIGWLPCLVFLQRLLLLLAASRDRADEQPAAGAAEAHAHAECALGLSLRLRLGTVLLGARRRRGRRRWIAGRLALSGASAWLRRPAHSTGGPKLSWT